MRVVRFVMAVGLWGFCALAANAQTGSLNQTYEDWQTGTRLQRDGGGWIDHGTVQGKSFVGVTEETASPFDGGCKSFKLFQAPDDPQGFWLSCEFPKADGRLRFSFDWMVPDPSNTLAQISLASPVWNPKVCLLPCYRGNLANAPQPGYALSIPIAPVKPHIWYRAEITVPGTNGAGTFDLVLMEDQEGRGPPVRQEFKGLKCYTPAAGDDTVNQLVIGEGGTLPVYYLDNVRIEH
jgi:hypothetical protein